MTLTIKNIRFHSYTGFEINGFMYVLNHPIAPCNVEISQRKTNFFQTENPLFSTQQNSLTLFLTVKNALKMCFWE